MEHLKMQSRDLVSDNIRFIAERWPECLTEAKDENGKLRQVIDFDKLRQVLSSDAVGEGQERYQFTWPDKRHAIRLANAPITDTLRPCREESVDFDTTQNLYIEGDNLNVLKLLRENYLGKVKMIYIDPPYNTGGDFVYKDNFIRKNSDYKDVSGSYDEEGNLLVGELEKNADSNGRFHTDWLNMIYPRLKVARDLLSEDGVIFISIDDNEVENLKKVCDELFGSSNFIIQIAWRRTDNQSNIGMTARVKEYVLVYAKHIKSVGFYKLPLTEKAKKEYQYKDEKGFYGRGQLREAVRGRHHYEIVTPNGYVCNGPWLIPQQEFEKLVSDNLIHWPEKEGGMPRRKIYLKDMMNQGQIPNDFWGIEFGTNQRACAEIDALFNKRYFDFPKPVLLLSNIVKLGAKENSIILDFFSGSATTAHAVMQLNSEDGGNRKFIMVQLPEETDENSEARKAGYKNICEIGKERIRRAGKKIKEESPLTTQDLDTGFRVLKLDSSNMEDVFYTPAETTEQTLFSDNIKPDRTDEDLLFQVMLELGILLSDKIEKTQIAGKTVWNVGEGYLMACFEENVNEDTIKAIAKQKPAYFVMADRSLESDNVGDNFEQLFEEYSPETIRRIL